MYQQTYHSLLHQDQLIPYLEYSPKSCHLKHLLKPYNNVLKPLFQVSTLQSSLLPFHPKVPYIEKDENWMNYEFYKGPYLSVLLESKKYQKMNKTNWYSQDFTCSNSYFIFYLEHSELPLSFSLSCLKQPWNKFRKILKYTCFTWGAVKYWVQMSTIQG